MESNRQTTLIATIGGQPQVVTFALDDLLSRGIAVTQVVLIHLPSPIVRLQVALQKVIEEIEGPRYKNSSLRLTLFPMKAGTGSMDDIRDEADAHAAWEAINQLVIGLKETYHTLHVCISGGRRMLGLLTMSAAMLHFGHQDMLWHMYTPHDLLASSQEGALMHLPPNSGFKLIQVPMMPWGSYFPVLRQLMRPVTQEKDVLAMPRQLLEYGEASRREAVFKQLTSRQKEVLDAFAQGLTPQQVADKLFVSVKTVDSHKTVILAECRNAWALPEGTWLDFRFLADKFEAFR